jgi:hypothetical protein
MQKMILSMISALIIVKKLTYRDLRSPNVSQLLFWFHRELKWNFFGRITMPDIVKMNASLFMLLFLLSFPISFFGQDKNISEKKSTGSRLPAQSTQLTVASPDKQIVLSLSIDQAKLHYQVSYKGRMVIEPSLMGLTINHKVLPEATAFGVAAESSVNKTYISRGVHSNAVNSYNQAIIQQWNCF